VFVIADDDDDVDSDCNTVAAAAVIDDVFVRIIILDEIVDISNFILRQLVQPIVPTKQKTNKQTINQNRTMCMFCRSVQYRNVFLVLPKVFVFEPPAGKRNGLLTIVVTDEERN
jgi:hypothetical protein